MSGRPLVPLVAALLALAGCSSLAPGAGEVASLGFTPADEAPGSPASTYVRIARGAKSCWFGASGALRGTHAFVGEVKPESDGGDASITIYEREADGARGLKAFSVAMTHKGEGTSVARENVRIPEPLGGQMLADVDRWAEGEAGCAGEAATWTPLDPGSEEAKPAAKPKKGTQT